MKMQKKRLEEVKPNGAPSIETKLQEKFLSAVENLALTRSLRDEGAFSLQSVNPVKILIAFSGGRDSSALLSIAAAAFNRPHQSEIASITAMHIHHGLSENADSWLEFCRKRAESLGVKFYAKEVYVPRSSPIGIEAAAREARYRALFTCAREIGADAIFTAHHMDDQLETFLIQWMRGSGTEGLSGLAALKRIEKKNASDLYLCRPWLSVTREEINEYVNAKEIPYIEDESNSDSRYVRNLIRNEVFPLFTKARSGWKEAASRSIENIVAASHVLKDVAREDLLSSEEAGGKALSIEKLRRLTDERKALTLRFWLKKNGIRAPNKAKLEEMLRQIRESHTDTKLTIRFDGKEMRRWGNRLVLIDSTAKRASEGLDCTISWKGEDAIAVPAWGGVLHFEICKEGEEGFDAEFLKNTPLQICKRKGGEKIKLQPLRPSRNLKYLYQESDIPPFERERLPLVWVGKNLIYAAGLGSEVRLLADADLIQNRIKLVWIPDKSLLD